MKAIKVTSSTLVAPPRGEPPLPYGNCFSVETDGGFEYRIVNFSHENLEWLLEGGLTWPIEIDPLDCLHHVAVITDPRIPDDFFDEKFCEVCCPKDLLPKPQKLRIARHIAQGYRKEFHNADGYSWVSIGGPRPTKADFK